MESLVERSEVSVQDQVGVQNYLRIQILRGAISEW